MLLLFASQFSFITGLDCQECYSVYHDGAFIGKEDCFHGTTSPISVEATNCNSEHTKLERNGETVYTIWRGYGNRSSNDLFDQTEISIRYRKIFKLRKRNKIPDATSEATHHDEFKILKDNVKRVDRVILSQKFIQMLRTVEKDEQSGSTKLSSNYFYRFFLQSKLSVWKQGYTTCEGFQAKLTKISWLKHVPSVKNTTQRTSHRVSLNMEPILSNTIV